MAVVPYKGRNGWLYIVRSESQGPPKKPKVKEALKTKKVTEAKRKKSEFKVKYYEGKHDPLS